ncbi:hypothetical protein B0H11DRAFT_2224374 [Mycena galericulata]|nr:hypothetical protein B0H11DRAFT_2224374 [Mycena galericulata]
MPKASRFYPTENVHLPKNSRKSPEPADLRSSITPGSVLIHPAGSFRGAEQGLGLNVPWVTDGAKERAGRGRILWCEDGELRATGCGDGSRTRDVAEPVLERSGSRSRARTLGRFHRGSVQRVVS